MNTTELFDFHFVDRSIERNALNSFMSNTEEVSLWIKGERGFGKTEFFNYGLKQQSNFELCYFDVKINKNSAEIISDFIIELQKHCNLDFMSLLKEKYKHFYSSIYLKTKEITSELFPQIINIASIILDTGYYAVTFSDENKNPVDIINDYITLIVSKKKFCLCIDNFSRCDVEVAQIFFQIIKKFITNSNFKSCIITTSEDLTCELKDAILHNLPWTDIKINKLGKFDYFFQILNPIFVMDDFSDEDMNYIYQKCKGSPKKLSTIISKLLEKNGITLFPNGKSTINKEILFSILQADHVKFDENDFTPEQKWVIFSYLCLTEQITIQQLKDLALYISKKCLLYQAYNEEVFSRVLLGLIENNILAYGIKDQISTHHDLDYIELMDILNSSPIKNLFSQYAYEFLLTYNDHPEREKLICHHAYIAQVSNWQILNFRYGKKLYKERLFYDAHKVFSCLSDCYSKLSYVKMLLIAITTYETGNYHLAMQQFNLIDPAKLQFKQLKYNYFFYIGKTYNNIGKTEQAIKYLQHALNEVNENSKEYVQTLNVLHMYCFEIPKRLNQAKDIFIKIQTTYKDLWPHEWANTMRGCQNFLDDKTSLIILEEADTILNDKLEKAYLKTTKGFVLVKQNQLELAEKQFSDASNTIKKLKIHEFSYAANNLAICYMMKRNYIAAKQILLEALFWNRTNYGELVLNTHLMICSLYLDSKSECCSYYDFLKKYMENNNILDPIANRKIYINLAITSSRLGNLIAEKAYYEKAKTYIANSSSEWRYYILTNQIDKAHRIEPDAEYQKILDFDPWFLIYAHD